MNLSSSVKILSVVILLNLVFHFPCAFGQSKPDMIKIVDFKALENQIKSKKYLLLAQQDLQDAKKEATSTHDDIMLARSLNDLMLLLDQITEDTLYFKNSAFIDTMLVNSRSANLNAILHLMRAQRIARFDSRYRRFNYAAYRIKGLNPDYAALTNRQRDSLVGVDLSAALQLYHGAKANSGQLLWLSGSPDVFLFDFGFEDIVLSEWVNLLVTRSHFFGNPHPLETSWAGLSQQMFKNRLDSLSAKDSTNTDVLSAYNRWLKSHKNEPEISSFIESLARKYAYLSTYNPDSVTRQAYIGYLQHSVSSVYPAVKAHAIYQLCLIWNEEGNKYARPENAYIYPLQRNFDPQYQFYPAKAIHLYEQNKDLLYKYQVFNQVLIVMERQIKSAGVSIEMHEKCLPGEEIPIRAIYKNTDSLYYRIIPINSNEPAGGKKVVVTEQLLVRRTAAQGIFALPLPADYNKHAAFLKLKKLPIGYYRLLFSNKPIKTGGYSVNNMAFEVTNIAAVNTDQKIFVLNRKTGYPISGAKIKAFKNKASVTIASAITKANGEVDMPGQLADSINIVYKGDTSGYNFSVRQNTMQRQVYDKDEFDNLDDFYNEKLHLEIFTDRSIYRPGQTVHYKAIFLTNDADTGDGMVFNEQNVGSAIYKRLLNKWLDDKDDRIILKNSFDKSIDSAQIKLNEFGSFAGEFTIPKTAATGDWKIFASMPIYNRYGSYNVGNIRVEEYKRPTLELSMEKQKKMLMPGEPFRVKFKLRSLSGADLSNIPVNYTINRSGRIPDSKGKANDNYSNTKLIQDTGYTDDKGELSISVNDTLLSKLNLADSVEWQYYYSINAIAVDATGERVEINESFNVSSRPVRISIPINTTYDKQSFPALNVSTNNVFEGVVGRKVNVKLYKVSELESVVNDVNPVDQWYYAQSDWNSWFPDMAKAKTIKPERTLILDTVVNTAAYEKLVIDKELLKAGFYELKAIVKDNNRILGQISSRFNVFDSKTGDVAVDDVDYMPLDNPRPGSMIKWYSSGKNNGYTIYHVVYIDGAKKAVKNVYVTVKEKAGIRQWVYRIPKDATGQVLFNRISVSNNKVYKHQKTIYISQTGPSPEIIIEKYRKVMVPGEQETFTLSVKTKKDNVAAEIMTTLYDAALDKLEPHHWNLPNTAGNYYLYTNWTSAVSFTKMEGNYPLNEQTFMMRGEMSEDANQIFTAVEGRAQGLSITNAHGLNEVVVVGYGTQAKRDITGSVSNVMIRGISSLNDYKQPLIVLDGEVYAGNLSSLSPNAITQIMVLKGTDASALYGARAAEGVLIISTKGPIVLPEGEKPIVKVRKNFNETAFFYPQVHAGADGYYSFSFTMPETATEWNWKMLAHTSNAKFAYLERKLQTQLNLMVQPNMPRVLYQGDKINLQSRVSNLDTVAIKGKAFCKIEDAVTGQDITAKLTDNNGLDFNLNKKSSGAISFLLHVPAQQLNPLKIVISVTSGSVADAEEHIIPVLSSRIFIKQSQPVQFADKPQITLSPVKLPADASLYGMGLSVNQKPQAALVYALPWLANYSYNCAEQTFNKLRADVTALRLMQKDTLAQKAFKNAVAHVEKNRAPATQIPDDIAEETMPWLGITNQTAVQQKQLFNLLDTPSTKTTINKHLERLHKLQSADGGLMWFEGGNSSAYISSLILAGFGQLKQQGGGADRSHTAQQKDFIRQLFSYNQQSLSRYADGYEKLYALYAMSYWIKDQDLPAPALSDINILLNSQWKAVDDTHLGQQAMLIISTLRYNNAGSTLYQKALQQLKSIRQLAIQDEQHGLRWKAISDSEELDNSAEETMALLAEAFETAGNNKEVDAGIIKWLLTEKTDQHWQTTKATAAAINLLQKQTGSMFGETKAFSAQVTDRNLSVSDGLLDGAPMVFAEIGQMPDAITLQQHGTKASGYLTWYYFAEPKHLDTLNKVVKISRLYYIYDEQKGWLTITPNTLLKTGDRVKVKLSIETSSRLKFVHITDPRAAGFEPKDNKSGYQYNNGFGYYQSVRDTGMELFTESIPKGISEISYELVVAHSGDFASGPVVLQCMYRPSVTAYSTSARFKTN